MCVCVCTCMCVCEREKGRRNSVSVRLRVSAIDYVGGSVWKIEFVSIIWLRGGVSVQSVCLSAYV